MNRVITRYGSFNGSDGRVVRATASGAVHWFASKFGQTYGFKIGFHSLKGTVWENKPASLLVSLEKVLSGTSPSGVVDRWPATP